MIDTPALKKVALFLALFVLAVVYGLRAQQTQTLRNDYVFTTGVGTSADWLTPTLAYSNIIRGDDKSSALMNLGFDFVFEGKVINTFSVHTNGQLRLGYTQDYEGQSYRHYSTPFSSTNVFRNAPKIVAVGADLYVPSSSTLTYGVAGTAPNRVGVYKYNGYPKGYSAEKFSFQVQLYESTGEIRILYGTSKDSILSLPFQIGIAASTSDVLTVNPHSHALAYGTTTAADTIWPGAYRYYSFVPRKIDCAYPYNLSTTQVGEDSVLLDWDVYRGTYSVVNYIVEYGVSGFARGTGRRISSSTKPVYIGGLQHGVNYTFYVRAVCDTFDTSAYSLGSDFVYCNSNRSACFDFTALNSPGVTCTYGTYQFYGNYSTYYKGPYAYEGRIDYGQDSYGSKDAFGSRHTVHTRVGEMDSCSGWKLSKIPPGECKSVRLGCVYGQHLCQAVSYDMIIDTNVSDILLLKYACVFYNPSHNADRQPRFVLEILDSLGNFVDFTCGSADFNSSNAATAGSGWNRGRAANIFWKDWTPVGLYLGKYHGQHIKVRLTSFACGHGADIHYGYAYYTLSCAKAKMRSSSCTFGDTATITAPLGFNYKWFSSADTTQPLSINRSLQVVLDSNTYYCDISFIDNPNCKFRMSYNHFLVPDTIRDTVRHIICPGGSCTVNGETYYRPGWYLQNLRTVRGCDSLLYIYVRNLDTIRDTIYRTVCAGARFDTNGQSYYLTGEYTQHLRQPDSCYNNLVIRLTVNDTLRDTIYRTICAGARFDTNGQSYFLAGEYTQHLRQPDSCFNNLVIRLTVNDTLRDTIYRTICAGARFDNNGQSYFLAGEYTQHLRQPDSCFNNLVIRLTVNDTLRDTIYRTICAGARFDTNGQSYYLAGEYTQHLRQPDSCFNNLIIRLTVNDTLRDTIYRTLCAGARFDTNGQSYINTGFYSQLHRDTVLGCYSRLNIDLVVHDTFRNVIWQNICAGATFTQGGQSYYLQGTYFQRLHTIYGCDSITEIHLTVNDTLRDTLDFSLCAGQTVTVNDSIYYLDGWYRQNLRTPDGCDSILHIHLDVADTLRDTLYFSACAGKTMDVNGQIYANRGWYRQHLRTPDGCDSILHIALMVDDTIRSHDYDTICDGNIYMYHDSAYSVAGAYRHLLKTPDGCDSIVTMHLFVRDTAVTHIYDTISSGDSYEFFGEHYSQQGVYSEVLTRQKNGCDSTIVLHLKVCRTTYTHLYDTICTNGTYIYADSVITDFGVFSRLEYSVDHCDSIILLHLTVLDYPTLSIVDSGTYCKGGTATLAAVTNANHITWSSYPADSTLVGQEHDFVIHVAPDRYVEYMATVDIQPYSCVTTGVVSLNKPSEIIAAMTMYPSEITTDNLQVAFSDISYGEVILRRWLFHEDDPITRDRQVFNDSIVHYSVSPISDSLEVTLVVSSGYGCHDTAVNIYPILKGDIWVPNAFTPGRHSAKQNHLFKIGHNNVLDYEIYIYSRAGLFVFHSTDPDISWDGTYQHKDCIPGAYVYIIRYTTKKYPKIIREKKGSVLLIR